jgi:hypothetical protein
VQPAKRFAQNWQRNTLMKPSTWLAVLVAGATFMRAGVQGASDPGKPADERIRIIDPPEKDFYSKVLDYHGIPIKAHQVVSDEAMFEAWRRIDMLLTNLPMALSNLVAAGSEFHIIGANQVTTDLPEWRADKHVPLDEYNGLTRDRRTRGMGGLVASCGEENLLKLPTDRYRGRDICIHEFTHGTFDSGIPQTLRQKFLDQLKRSLDKGLWVNSYAASGRGGEFLSELTMWYWGTHGDLSMQGPKPENGREGLKKYDPEVFALVDDFYSGRIEIGKVEPRFRRPAAGFTGRTPRDSLVARAVVAHLSSYQTGETRIGQFFADAGMNGPGDGGTNGWHVTRLENTTSEPAAATPADPDASIKFRVFFRDPRNRQTGPAGGGSQNPPGTNAMSFQAARTGGRGGAGREPSLADLQFKAGVLSAFVWNN